jgi:NhaA family Na+:H+ antiporter
LKWSGLPSGAQWKHIVGVGLLGGIGFTMSIFISLLSFDDVFLQSEAKFSILIASVLAGSLGFIYLKSLNKSKVTPTDNKDEAF